MNITANEVLLLNRKYNNMMKSGNMNEETAPQEPQAPVSNPESVMNALALQGQNNMAFGSVMSKIRNFAKVPVLVAGLTMAAPLVTSCIKQEQEINIDMSMMERLLAELEAMRAETQAQRELQQQMLEFFYQWREEQHGDSQAQLAAQQAIYMLMMTISGQIGDLSDGLSAYFTQLFQQLGDMNTNVINGLTTVINNQNLQREQDDAYMQQVLALLLSTNTDVAANRTLLTQILAKLGDLESGQSIQGYMLQQIIPILVNIEADNAAQTGYLANISNKVDNIDANLALAYVNGLNKLDTIINNQNIAEAQRDSLMSLGLQILAKIPNNIPGGSSADYTAILNAIYAELAQLGVNLTNSLNTIANKQDTINNNMLSGFQYMMANDDANTAAIIAAMDAARANIALQIAGLGTKLDGISTTITADMAQIIANQGIMITGQTNIQNAVEALTPYLVAIEAKIPPAYNDSALRAELNTAFALQLTQAQLANSTLVDILNAIPEGCHCQTLDLSVVINILNQILAKIGGSNEGVDNGVGNELD